VRLGKDRHGLPIGSTGAAAVAGGSAVAAAVLMRQAAKMFALPRAIFNNRTMFCNVYGSGVWGEWVWGGRVGMGGGRWF